MRIKKLFSFFTALLLISSLFANIVFASELTVPENAAETESILEPASAPGAENTGTSEQESEGTEAEPAADNSEGERNTESGNEADRNENPGNEAAEGDNNGNDAGDGEAAENENGSAENEAAPEAVLTEETETENTAAAEEKLTPYKPEEGVYTIATALDAGKLLDVPNGTKNPGVAIQILDKNDKDSQQFRLIKNSDGSYRIMSVNADKALEIKNESDEVGAGVVQNFKTAKSYQKWSFFKDNEGNVQIISNTVRKYCICVEKGKAVNKAKIRTAVPAAGNPKDQRFAFTLVKSAAEDKPEPVKEGVYVIRTGVDTNMVVDIAGAKKTAAANVQIYKYNGSDAQKFIVTQVGENAFTLTNVNSGRAIDTYDGKKTAATNVVQYALDGTSTQNWILEPADRGYYYLKNSGSGLYLDIKGAKRDNAANIQIYTGNRSDAQKFRFELVDEKRTMPDGLYIFHSRLNSQVVLDIRGASINNTANVQLYTNNDTNAQKFRVTYAGDGWYTILNDNSGKALDVKGAKNANSVNVQQYAANGTKAQKWRFAATDSGYHTVFSGVGTDKVLDAAGGKSKNGTNIQIYKTNGTEAQQFLLIPTKHKEEPKATIEIDPGHQRHGDSKKEPIGPGASKTKARCTSGACSEWTGQEEYELNLEVSLKLKKILEDRGYKVFMTRTTHEVNISNKERAEKATKDGADIFVRIHADDVSSHSVNGVLNFGPASGNPYLSSDVVKNSQRLAKLLTKYQCKATGQRARDNVFRNDMTGINWATMPVTIVEMGLMSNKTEAYNLKSSAFQDKIAKGIADGIDAYFANETP